MLSSYLDPCLGPQAPLTQSMCKRRKHSVELPELHPCGNLVLSLLLWWWFFFGWWVLRSPLHLFRFMDKFICFCLQLRAATWLSLMPLVISQAQWFLFFLTRFTAVALLLTWLCSSGLKQQQLRSCVYLTTQNPTPLNHTQAEMQLWSHSGLGSSPGLSTPLNTSCPACWLGQGTNWPHGLPFPYLHNDDNIVYLTGLLRGLNKIAQCLGYIAVVIHCLLCLYHWYFSILSFIFLLTCYHFLSSAFSQTIKAS